VRRSGRTSSEKKRHIKRTGNIEHKLPSKQTSTERIEAKVVGTFLVDMLPAVEEVVLLAGERPETRRTATRNKAVVYERSEGSGDR
jgi:hypothetical protein